MSKLAKALSGSAGNAGDDSLYVEDVFSAYLYYAAHGTSPIVNGINLADDGGMVWFKNRASAYSNVLFDTERGTSNHLVSNTTAGNSTSIGLSSFNTDGFSFSGVNLNVNSESHVAWTFRKAEKFFDVVTYTGNSTAGRTIAHNLGSVPGMMIVKGTSNATAWWIFHTSTGATKFLEFSSQPPTTDNASWNNTAPTDSVFTLGSDNSVNGSGRTYVAYLFASDAGGFGDDETENIIKCGSFNGAANTEVDLGFEPQYIMFKNTTSASNWQIVDMMRGMPVGSDDRQLMANSTNAESDNGLTTVTATGFTWLPSASGNTYIYIAIRRPMKTPESGTEVFAMDTLGSTGDGNQPGYRSPFPVDMGLKTSLTGNQRQISTRLLQGTELLTESTAAEAASASKQFDYMNGTDTSTATSSVNMMWMFKRATGFMDVVCYTGTGVAKTEAHNLGVVPELMICKRRSTAREWLVYTAPVGNTKGLYLNYNLAPNTFTGYWNDTTPTDSVFTLGNGFDTNSSGDTYVAYLFATLAGVSKVGSYTGTGADLNVDCGFTAGARFILIKRTDSTGDWYVYDSVRGISAGNDPYFFLNDTAAQVTNTDYIDPLNAGFTVTSSAPAGLNANGGTYIFLAIA